VKQVTQFEAFDVQRFDSESECKTHEGGLSHMRLVGLTAEDIEDAISRDNVDLADAIEAVGAKIARARRESGDLRRERKGKIQGPPMAPGSET
jgi:hypothetical protein